MKAKLHYFKSNSFLASATGVGSVGAALFGVPGAIIGIVLGFGVGYWSAKTSSHLSSTSTKEHKAHA